MGYFDDLPWTTRVRTFLIASSGILLDGYDLSTISFALLLIRGELHLTTLEYSLSTASSLFGMIIGSIIMGWLSDKAGRKTLLGIDLLFFLIFGTLSALSTNFAELFTFRLLLGVGIGADYPISSSLMAEVASSQSRGKYLIGSVAMYWIGTGLAAGLTASLLYLGPYFWRYVFLIGGLLAIPIVLARLTISESPRWMVMAGKLAGNNVPTREEETVGLTSFKGLFSSKVIKITTYVLAAWFLFDVASYGIGLYYPLLLSDFGFKTLYSVAIANVFIAVAAIGGYLLALPLIDTLGRKGMLLAGFGGMAFILFFGAITRATGYSLLATFMSFAAIEQWAGAITLFYPTEVFPTSVRASGQGLATAVSRVGAVIGVFVFPYVTTIMGLSRSLIMFGIFSLVGLILTAFLAKETKKKALEEISKKIIS
ncbi:MFS transporter [Sulfolobales archaeon HS-7]|nr:MFS transporter [Sulfolobales archaeon HS-7]